MFIDQALQAQAAEEVKSTDVNSDNIESGSDIENQDRAAEVNEPEVVAVDSLSQISDVAENSERGRRYNASLHARSISNSQRSDSRFTYTAGHRRSFTPIIRIKPQAKTDFRVMVLGSKGCGKSALIDRMAYDVVSQTYKPTFGCAFKRT